MERERETERQRDTKEDKRVWIIEGLLKLRIDARLRGQISIYAPLGENTCH